MEARMFGVYIMGNNRPTLYIGMTNNLYRRILEHKEGKIKGFTQKYKLDTLLYYELYENIFQAIIREKQLKNLKRAKKLKLIQTKNPYLTDIFSELTSVVSR